MVLPAGALEVSALGDGSGNMAEVLRSNEGLRRELDRSQRMVAELREQIKVQAEKMKELQAERGSQRESNSDSDAPVSWFSYFFLPREETKGEQAAVDPGCHSVRCCLTLISDWAVGIGRFLASGIWEFFWDPVEWWQGARGSIFVAIRTQVQLLSRVLGIALLGIYINLISWIVLRVRQMGTWVRRMGKGIWNLPVVSLGMEVTSWGLGRFFRETSRDQKPDQLEQLMKKMDDLAKVVHKMQSAPAPLPRNPPLPQRTVPAVQQEMDERIRRPCPNCGQKGHLLATCPSPKRCLRCRSTRHLARDCPNIHAVTTDPHKQGNRRWATHLRESAESPYGGDLVRRVEDLSQEVAVTSNVAEGSRAAVLNVLAGMGVAKGKILVDTGSSVNVMPRSFAEDQGLELSTDTEETGMKLKSFNGAVSDVIGTVVLPVTVGRWKATIPFVVTEACSSVILGMPGLRDLDVKVDPARRCLEDRSGRLVFCQTVDVSAPAYSLEMQKN